MKFFYEFFYNYNLFGNDVYDNGLNYVVDMFLIYVVSVVMFNYYFLMRCYIFFYLIYN